MTSFLGCSGDKKNDSPQQRPLVLDPEKGPESAPVEAPKKLSVVEKSEQLIDSLADSLRRPFDVWKLESEQDFSALFYSSSAIGTEEELQAIFNPEIPDSEPDSEPEEELDQELETPGPGYIVEIKQRDLVEVFDLSDSLQKLCHSEQLEKILIHSFYKNRASEILYYEVDRHGGNYKTDIETGEKVEQFNSINSEHTFFQECDIKWISQKQLDEPKWVALEQREVMATSLFERADMLYFHPEQLLLFLFKFEESPKRQTLEIYDLQRRFLLPEISVTEKEVQGLRLHHVTRTEEEISEKEMSADDQVFDLVQDFLKSSLQGTGHFESLNGQYRLRIEKLERPKTSSNPWETNQYEIFLVQTTGSGKTKIPGRVFSLIGKSFKLTSVSQTAGQISFEIKDKSSLEMIYPDGNKIHFNKKPSLH